MIADKVQPEISQFLTTNTLRESEKAAGRRKQRRTHLPEGGGEVAVDHQLARSRGRRHICGRLGNYRTYQQLTAGINPLI